MRDDANTPADDHRDTVLVLKHRETGEIIGYWAPFDVPTVVVRAVKTANGWREVV